MIFLRRLCGLLILCQIGLVVISENFDNNAAKKFNEAQLLLTTKSSVREFNKGVVLLKELSQSKDRDTETAGKAFAELAMLHLFDSRLGSAKYTGRLNIAAQFAIAASELGNAQGHHIRSFMQYYGFGINWSIRESLQYEEYSASQGYFPALFATGFHKMYDLGQCSVAIRYYRLGALTSSGVMANEVNGDYASFVAVDKFKDIMMPHSAAITERHLETIRWWEYHAQRQSSLRDQALFELGRIYHYARCGVDRDMVKAISYYEKSAELGYPSAMGMLGRLLTLGHGCRQDLPRALTYLTRAAAVHEATAMATIGSLVLKEVFYSDDQTLPLHYLWNASQLGSVDASWELSQIDLRDGRVGNALTRLHEAAQQGHVRSLLSLAQLYDDGVRVNQSCVAAALLYKRVSETGLWIDGKYGVRAAQKALLEGRENTALLISLLAAQEGHFVAQYNSAWLIMEKTGITLFDKPTSKKSSKALDKYAVAMELLTRALAQEPFHPAANLLMARMLLQGLGTTRNATLAFACLERAAAGALATLSYGHQPPISTHKLQHDGVKPHAGNPPAAAAAAAAAAAGDTTAIVTFSLTSLAALERIATRGQVIAETASGPSSSTTLNIPNAPNISTVLELTASRTYGKDGNVDLALDSANIESMASFVTLPALELMAKLVRSGDGVKRDYRRAERLLLLSLRVVSDGKSRAAAARAAGEAVVELRGLRKLCKQLWLVLQIMRTRFVGKLRGAWYDGPIRMLLRGTQRLLSSWKQRSLSLPILDSNVINNENTSLSSLSSSYPPGTGASAETFAHSCVTTDALDEAYEQPVSGPAQTSNTCDADSVSAGTSSPANETASTASSEAPYSYEVLRIGCGLFYLFASDGHTCLRVDGTGGLCDASAVLAFVPDAALNNQQRHKRHDGSQSRRDTNGKETNHGSEYDNGHSEIEVEDVMDGFGFLVAPFWGSVGPPDGSHSLVEFRKTGKGHGGMDSDGAGKGRGSQGPIEQRVVNDSENTAQPYTATQGARNSLATASAQEAIVPAQATDKLHPRLVTKKGAMSYLAKIKGCFINATGRTQRQSRSLMPFLDKYFRYDPNKNGSWGFGTSNDHERWVATLARTSCRHGHSELSMQRPWHCGTAGWSLQAGLLTAKDSELCVRRVQTNLRINSQDRASEGREEDKESGTTVNPLLGGDRMSGHEHESHLLSSSSMSSSAEAVEVGASPRFPEESGQHTEAEAIASYAVTPCEEGAAEVFQRQPPGIALQAEGIQLQLGIGLTQLCLASSLVMTPHTTSTSLNASPRADDGAAHQSLLSWVTCNSSDPFQRWGVEMASLNKRGAMKIFCTAHRQPFVDAANDSRGRNYHFDEREIKDGTGGTGGTGGAGSVEVRIEKSDSRGGESRSLTSRADGSQSNESRRVVGSLSDWKSCLTVAETLSEERLRKQLLNKKLKKGSAAPQAAADVEGDALPLLLEVPPVRLGSCSGYEAPLLWSFDDIHGLRSLSGEAERTIGGLCLSYVPMMNIPADGELDPAEGEGNSPSDEEGSVGVRSHDSHYSSAEGSDSKFEEAGDSTGVGAAVGVSSLGSGRSPVVVALVSCEALPARVEGRV